MERKTFLTYGWTKAEVSNVLLGSAELGRLGIIDREASAPLNRELRIALLGIEGLRDQKQKPRHRPPTIDAALLRDKIVQAVLFERISHPKKQRKRLLARLANIQEWADRCLRKISPERRASIEQSIMTMTLWPYAMAAMYGLTASFIRETNNRT
jgi:hypothetical protein